MARDVTRARRSVDAADQHEKRGTMDLGISGLHAVVTGGSSGIGLACASQLAQEGVVVVLVARSAAKLATAAKSIQAAGGQALTAVADTGSDEEVASMARGVLATVGRVDILVNAAARPNLQPIAEEDLAFEINVKVAGYLRCIRAFAPGMVEAGWGRIVNIGGMSALRTTGLVSSIRNAGVVAMTKNLGDELGVHGVNTTVVHPGLTRTERTTPELEEAQAGQSSIGRIVDAAEVADVVTFLCSRRSVAINGETVIASGGVPGPIRY